MFADNDNLKIPGYMLIEKRFVKEVNADCYYFEHIKSGAKIIKIAADDPNKTFSVTFHTIPNSDCGEAHILEHSVLNGSKNFPVKSPFDIAVKGSLNTFINAMTYKDRTSYPVASMNEKDYFNLMHIYLDAVFFPMIYNDERIFKQEGWHYELTDLNSDLEYKGVVYGEMKGAFSDPSRYVSMYIYKNLFPDNIYGFESGGYPSDIPKLTYEKFLDFHKTFYHPENSYIVLYGNADMKKELEFIDKNYLSKFEKNNKKIQIPDHKPFEKLKRVEEFYPVMEGTETKNKAYLTLSFVTDYGTDYVKPEAISLLTYYLFNREAAPIRLAFEEAGIGKNISCNSMTYKQNIIQITVQDANANELDKFYELIMTNLKKIADEGINKEEFESILNIYEFSRREDNDANKGISYLSDLMPYFIYNKDPFAGLEYENVLAELKNNLKTDYYEELIKSVFIDNNYSLLLSVSPKPGMDKEIAEQEKVELKKFKESKSEAELQKIIDDTDKLIEYQQSEDTPEALATIPVLDLKDLDKKPNYYEAEVKKFGNTDVLHYPQNTNDIVYLYLYFDLRVLTQDLIPYASLLTNLMGSLNTKNYSFGDLDTEINRHTGGINTYLTKYNENNDDDKLIPKFVVSSKALVEKSNKLFEINEEIINNTIYNDPERLKTLLLRHFSSLDAQIKRDGSRWAFIRFLSYISNSGLFNELTTGYEYYAFLSDLMKNYDENSQEIINNLTKVADLLFTQENLIIATTCSEENYKTTSENFTILTKKLKSAELKYVVWSNKSENKNEAFQTASKVQYVYSGYDFKKLGYEWDGKMLVLNKIISRNWLNQQIRVIGGAYGGYSTISPTGYVAFISYRDPNLKETLDNYSKTSDFLENFTATEKEMTQFIISTIADLDQPKNVSEQGTSAFYNYFCKLDYDYYQDNRNAVLNTSAEDIKSFAKMINDVISNNIYCIYGNSNKIEENKTLFENLIKIL